jgi:hypothetical protein
LEKQVTRNLGGTGLGFDDALATQGLLRRLDILKKAMRVGIADSTS